MKIAIIETGLPPEDIRNDFPSYPIMFADLIGLATKTAQFTTYSFCHSEFEMSQLPSLDSYDGFLITGSPAGVYEDWPWMQPLFQFIRQAASQRKPLVGICFGHQAIAQALGGKVTKSPKGWGIGRHTYQLHSKPDWMLNTSQESSTTLKLAVSHQDQVIDQPSDTEILASSEFCEFAALYYPSAPALTFQGHPEFSDDFAAALYKVRRNTSLKNENVEAALTSLEQANNNACVAHWLWNFYQHHTA